MPICLCLKWHKLLLKNRKKLSKSLFGNCLFQFTFETKVKRDATDQLCVLTGRTSLYDYKGTVCLDIFHKYFTNQNSTKKIEEYLEPQHGQMLHS